MTIIIDAKNPSDKIQCLFMLNIRFVWIWKGLRMATEIS